MIKPVYDISPEDIHAVDWLNCRLVMEMNEQYFLYTVVHGNKSVLALKYYAFAVDSHYPLRDQLYEIIKSDELLQKHISEVVIIYNLADSLLIPEAYFNQDLSQHMLEFLHGDLKKGLLFHEKLEEEKVYNVFRVPSDIHEFFQTGFSSAKFWHYFTIWSKCTTMGRRATDGVSVIFYPNNLLISVFASGKAQLLQSKEYQTPEDIAYQLLNIFHQFNFSQEDTPLEIGGLVDVDSAVYEELLKYFQHIQRVTYPAQLQLAPGFETLPDHFFSPLLTLGLCVS